MSDNLLIEAPKAQYSSKDLVLLRISRLKDGKNGILLYVKSEQMESFIRANTVDPAALHNVNKTNYYISSAPGWADHYGYKVKATDELKMFQGWGGALIQGHTANLSFFTARGLKDGVTFEFEGMYSQTAVDRFMTEVKRGTKQIYNEYLKEKNYALRCIIAELE